MNLLRLIWINVLSILMLPFLLVGFIFSVVGKMFRLINVLFLCALGSFLVLFATAFFIETAASTNVPIAAFGTFLYFIVFPATCILIIRFEIFILSIFIPPLKNFRFSRGFVLLRWVGTKIEAFGVFIVRNVCNRCMNGMYGTAGKMTGEKPIGK